MKRMYEITELSETTTTRRRRSRRLDKYKEEEEEEEEEEEREEEGGRRKRKKTVSYGEKKTRHVRREEHEEECCAKLCERINGKTDGGAGVSGTQDRNEVKATAAYCYWKKRKRTDTLSGEGSDVNEEEEEEEEVVVNMTSIAVQTLQSGDASPQAVAPPTMHADATAAAMTNGMYSEQKHVMDVVVASPPTVADVMACDPAAAAGAAAAAEGIVPTTKEAAVRSGSDVVADGIGVKNNMNFVVGGNATAKHLRASVSTPRTGPEDGTSRIPHLSILLKGPAWIALMTIEDAEPEKAVNVYEKIVELKRVVLQPKMKTKASSSSDNNSKPNSANEKLFATRVMSGGTISDDEVKGKNTSGDATAGGMYKSIDGHFGTTVVGGGTTQEGEGEDRSVKRKNVVSVDDSNNVVNTDKNSPSPNTNHAAKQAANNGEDESAHVTTYYNDDLRLHLPEQSLKKKRARRRGPRSKSSGYRGVTCYRRTGRWEAHSTSHMFYVTL